MGRKIHDRRHQRCLDRSPRGARARGRRLASTLVTALVVTGVAGVVVPASMADAATQTVTNCNNSGSGSLPQAVLNAGSGDTIAFAPSPPCSFVSLTATIDIGHDLTISGPGESTFTVSESVRKTAFVVEPGVTATISGLTIENGAVGIQNAGTLTVSDSMLSGNGSPTGGAIINTGRVDITGSTLSKNGADAPGEGGGAVDNQMGTVTVAGSTLTGNTASSGANGGAIYNHGGSVTITGSTLTGNNTGSGSGGAVYNEGGTTTIATTTVAGNSAVNGTGGGVDNDSGTVNVADSTLSRNSADYSSGGGGMANNGTATIADSTLFENSALLGGEGGGALNTGALTLTSDTFLHNGAADSGGGVYGPATVTGTILSMSTGGDCAHGVVDGGWNLADDTSCGFTGGTDVADVPALLAPGRLADNGGPTKTIALEALSPAVGAITSGSLCSAPDQRGATRPTPCDMGAVQLALPPQAIISPDHATAKVGTFFTFLVVTTGVPFPAIAIKGRLPKHMKVIDNGDGTATISGTPTAAGSYPVLVISKYGQRATKKIVTQSFTLTVDP